MRVHNHENTVLIIGTHNVADELAETGIKATKVGDKVMLKQGLGNAASYAVNPSNIYTIEVNLLQGADANSILRGYHEAFIQTGAEFPITFNTGSSEVITSAFATVTKEPDIASEKEVGERQWIITARRCVTVDNPDSLSIETLIPTTGEVLSFL